MNRSTLESLSAAVRSVQPPANYFKGRTKENLCLVENLILFSRTTRTELQRSTFESRPHHRYVLVMALECEGSVSIDSRVFHLSPGQGVLIFPYQFHQYLEIADEEILWLFMTFEHPDYDHLIEFRDTVFTLTPELVEMLTRITQLFTSGTDPSNDEELLLRATLFLNQLKSGVVGGDPSVHALTASKPEGKAGELLARIERELSQPDWPSFPTATELAARVGYSESRLRALFKQHVGISLGSYLRIYQIHRAISLMKGTEFTLGEVAMRAGFTSTTSFSRSFKAYTGTTPREFRSNMIGN